ncbi:MAG: hypothetical protein IJI10_09385 [Eubacterium sp.]|nr:hypothetical protein [Eubacterium sp.]
MKKSNKWLRSPIVTVVAFAVAIVLLLGAGIGTARAALTYFSEVYSTQIGMDNIGVSLLENGEAVSYRNYDSSKANGTWIEATGKLLDNMVEEGKNVELGKEYTEELSVRNTGIASGDKAAINEYVRVTIYKYWTDGENEGTGKERTLTPNLIKLKLDGVDLFDDSVTSYGNWIKDPSSTTKERVVLYYNQLLNAGSTTDNFANEISIDKGVMKGATQKQEGKKFITSYAYDGMEFNLEVQVDAVQEHNAQDAILSAWGKNVTISGTSLSL